MSNIFSDSLVMILSSHIIFLFSMIILFNNISCFWKLSWNHISNSFIFSHMYAIDFQ